jgi:hypothetical protein
VRLPWVVAGHALREALSGLDSRRVAWAGLGFDRSMDVQIPLAFREGLGSAGFWFWAASPTRVSY